MSTSTVSLALSAMDSLQIVLLILALSIRERPRGRVSACSASFLISAMLAGYSAVDE